MPGGQFTNLRQQAKGLGLGGRWREISEAYASANRVLGDIVKVTPSSKVVGDLALFMVTNNLSASDLVNPRAPLSYPRSVVEMLQGMLGSPEGGWPTQFQEAGTQICAGGRDRRPARRNDAGCGFRSSCCRAQRQVEGSASR